MNKKIVFIAGLLLSLILITNVLAITASIGNARMILRANVGDSLEKSILVKNVNNISVNIVLTASGDLKDSISIEDANFTLGPNEEKNAPFTIRVIKSGTTESKINVQFTPIGEKNGAGLSSTIVVIANGTDSGEEEFAEENAAETGDASETDTNEIAPKTTIKDLASKINLTKNGIAFLVTCITAVIFIVVLVIYYTKFKGKKRIIMADSQEEAWKNSRNSLITQLEKCDSQDEFSEIIDSAVSEVRYLKAKRGSTKFKKNVKKRA